jgi:hypothetical protein
MAKLSQKHREHITNLIFHNITECQSDDHYYFEKENKTIIWVQAQEHYLILDDATQKFSWESAYDLESTIEDFSDETLIEWYCDENSCDLEDLEEYIEDELEEAAE